MKLQIKRNNKVNSYKRRVKKNNYIIHNVTCLFYLLQLECLFNNITKVSVHLLRLTHYNKSKFYVVGILEAMYVSLLTKLLFLKLFIPIFLLIFDTN